jgi:hypothetical protein
MSTIHSDIELFLDRLASLRFQDVFNPYADACADYDRPGAAEIRRRNLALVLTAAVERGVDSIWVARDLGYRGGRRTGLAMTDDSHLDAHGKLFGTAPLVRPTIGPVVVERTASVIWDALQIINRPIFLWNVFPLHPHEPDDPMSNRRHNRAEREAARPMLAWLLEVLRPQTLIAVGRDAETALVDLGIAAQQVRHPSYGGQKEFTTSLHTIYGIGHVRQRDLLMDFDSAYAAD